jgi:hypothetical protein
MDEILIKRLNLSECDLNSISKKDLVGYLQTKNTISRVEDYLVSPFEKSLDGVEFKNNEVFSSAGIYLGVESNELPIYLDSSQVVSKFEEFMSDSLVQNSLGKRLDGVKQYCGKTTFDALNLNNLVNNFKSKKVGLERVLDFNFECSDLDDVVDVYSPRLAFLDSEFSFDVSNLTQNDVGFYVAGKTCVERLSNNIIKPFEDLFLSNSDAGFKSVFEFGDLGVFVNSNVSLELDYDSCLVKLQENLKSISSMGSEMSNFDNLFFNSDLINPRMYVSERYLSGLIEFYKSSRFPVVSKSLSVEYLPKFAHII